MAVLKRRTEDGQFKIVGEGSQPIRYLPDGTPAPDDYVVFDTGSGVKKTTVKEMRYGNVLSNPNLLDNGWFTVNQRAVTSASAGQYGVDRWIGACTISGSTITIPPNNGLAQKIEESIVNEFLGKTLTASVMKSDGTIYTGTVSLPSAKDGSNHVFYVDSDFGFDIVLDSTVNSSRIRVNVIGSESISIKAVKLELGSISTLANDTAPDYASELLKCQRYFLRCAYGSNTNTGVPMVATSDKACLLSLQHTMRAVPSVTISNIYISQNNSPHALDSIYIVTLIGSFINITFNSSGLSTTLLGILRFQNGYLELSADL